MTFFLLDAISFNKLQIFFIGGKDTIFLRLNMTRQRHFLSLGKTRPPPSAMSH